MADVDEIVFDEINYESITNYLVKERSFSEDRVQSTLNRLKKALRKEKPESRPMVLGKKVFKITNKKKF